MLTSGFIGPQILNFDRSLRMSSGPQTVLFSPAKFLLEVLVFCMTFYMLTDSVISAIVQKFHTHLPMN